MNVICPGGKLIGIAVALEPIEAFLSAHFCGASRHRRRLAEPQGLEHEET
jgi:ribose 5-phosphate isomerase B